MSASRPIVGMLVGGGPAPGINSVIGAVTIRSLLGGSEVLGFVDGFKWLMEGSTGHVHPLSIEEVSRIHFRGGSHLGTSRANPDEKTGASGSGPLHADESRRYPPGHDRGRRYGIFRAQVGSALSRAHASSARAENHRQ